MPGRCRLCKVNDRVALIESVSADLWESRRHGTLDDRPWNQAGSYWQRVYRELGETAVESLERDHVDHA